VGSSKEVSYKANYQRPKWSVRGTGGGKWRELFSWGKTTPMHGQSTSQTE